MVTRPIGYKRTCFLSNWSACTPVLFVYMHNDDPQLLHHTLSVYVSSDQASFIERKKDMFQFDHLRVSCLVQLLAVFIKPTTSCLDAN